MFLRDESRKHPVSSGFAIFLAVICLSAATTPVSGQVESRGNAPAHAKRSRPHSAISAVTFHAPPKTLAKGAVTDETASFLGPLRNGVSPETKLLRNWPSGGPKLVWEMATGSGYASPALSAGLLVFFHRVDNEARVECLDAGTGERHWVHTYPTSYKDRYQFSNGPRASPVIDDGKVYTLGAEGDLHCLELATGKLIWKRRTSVEFKVPQEFFGVVSTPLIEGNVLIVNVGAPGGPCVVGFDKHTGKIVWQAGDQWGASNASPVAAVIHGQRRVLVFAGGDSEPPTGGLLSIDPAKGTIDFRFPFRSKTYTSANASNPLVVGNQIFITSAYRTGGVLITPTPGEKVAVAWKSNALRSHFATPVHKGGYLYGFDGSGGNTSLVCVDIKTGRRQWETIPEWSESLLIQGKMEKRTFSLRPGAMISVDGDFLCLSEMGHLHWLDLSPKGYKELRRTKLFSAKETWTPPIISRGLLYVTQNTRDNVHDIPPRLLCYDLRAAQ